MKKIGVSRYMSTLTYLKNFIRDKNVASITPTSPFGVRKVCEKIDFKKRNVIIEFGPGQRRIFKIYFKENDQGL